MVYGCPEVVVHVQIFPPIISQTLLAPPDQGSQELLFSLVCGNSIQSFSKNKMCINHENRHILPDSSSCYNTQ